jgi:hypothetical protein
LAAKLHFPFRQLLGNERRSERPLVTLAIGEAMVLPKKKRVMLPVLIVLFLISYGLMSLLVVEQGRTIESQRSLIRDLFNDSTQLSAMKLREVLRERATAPPSAKVGAQSPASPSQVAPQGSARNKNAVKSQRQALERPPKAAADAADERRIPLTI